MAQTTRTFLAVEVPRGPAQRLDQLQRAEGEALPGVRWVAPGHYHITLAFLGDVADADLAAVCEAAADAVAPFAPFEVLIQGLGAFPSLKKPRTLWAGVVGTGIASLLALQAAVARAMRAVARPTDERFHPHVTLGRVKPGRGRSGDLAALAVRHANWSAGAFTIKELVTFSSTLRPEGPVYAPLARARLKGDAAGPGPSA